MSSQTIVSRGNHEVPSIISIASIYPLKRLRTSSGERDSCVCVKRTKVTPSFRAEGTLEEGGEALGETEDFPEFRCHTELVRRVVSALKEKGHSMSITQRKKLTQDIIDDWRGSILEKKSRK